MSGPRRQPMVRWARRMALLIVPLAIVGEAGHQLLNALGQTLAHHFFHIAFILAAGVIFGAYVWMDIRKNGWPTFSWRLRPRPQSRTTP